MPCHRHSSTPAYHYRPPSSSRSLHTPACDAVRHHYALCGCRSCIDGLWKIARHEGASVLWHGVNVSMLISVPMICMYLPMYDNLMAELGTSTTYAPLVAGSAARSVAVVATSPLELLKTRIQAAGATTLSNSKVASSSINPMSTALQQMRSDLKVCALRSASCA